MQNWHALKQKKVPKKQPGSRRRRYALLACDTRKVRALRLNLCVPSRVQREEEELKQVMNDPMLLALEDSEVGDFCQRVVHLGT